jgi:phospholipid/cholesterol/gamma-HCH transport system permease protein
MDWPSLRRLRLLAGSPVMLVLSRQVYFSGYQSALVVALAAALISSGFVLAFRGIAGTGLTSGAIDALALLSVRGLAVQVPAFIFCARSITATISELSLMSVTGELQALRRMGIGPFPYLILPRLLAAALAMMVLYLVFLVTALVSAFAVSALVAGVPIDPFRILAAFENIQPLDLVVGLFRSALLAAIAMIWVYRVEARGHSSFPQVSRAASFGVLRVMLIYLLAEVVYQALSITFVPPS